MIRWGTNHACACKRTLDEPCAPGHGARDEDSGASVVGQQRRIAGPRVRPLQTQAAGAQPRVAEFLAAHIGGRGAMRGAGAPMMRARSAYSSCSGSGVSSQPMYTDATEGSRAKCATAAAASSMWMRLAQCGGSTGAPAWPARSRSISCSRPGPYRPASRSAVADSGRAASNASASSRMRPLKPCGAGGVSRRPSRPGVRHRRRWTTRTRSVADGRRPARRAHCAARRRTRRDRRLRRARRGGQEDQAGDAGGQDGDAVGREMSPRSQAMPSASSAGGWRRRAWISTPWARSRRAQAQVAAADEQRALGHAHMPL